MQLVRIDLTQKRTIPINKWKKLSNITRMVATPNGLFVLTDIGQPNHLQSQLWFLADDASEPKLIKQFSPEEFVEMASTHENTLYLNIRLREEYEKVGALWMSDGTAEGTRLIKQGVEMNFGLN